MCRGIHYPKVKSYHPGSMGGPSTVSTHPSECCVKMIPPALNLSTQDTPNASDQISLEPTAIVPQQKGHLHFP
nr:hypothetical protein CFP56_41732 [Quercus suber]